MEQVDKLIHRAINNQSRVAPGTELTKTNKGQMNFVAPGEHEDQQKTSSINFSVKEISGGGSVWSFETFHGQLGQLELLNFAGHGEWNFFLFLVEDEVSRHFVVGQLEENVQLRTFQVVNLMESPWNWKVTIDFNYFETKSPMKSISAVFGNELIAWLTT